MNFCFSGTLFAIMGVGCIGNCQRKVRNLDRRCIVLCKFYPECRGDLGGGRCTSLAAIKTERAEHRERFSTYPIDPTTPF
jgi:hypothetical protein